MRTATRSRIKAPDIEWSHYQKAIFRWAEHGSGHSLVNAVAGAGKTRTLQELVNRIPKDQKVAVLAFNNHMAAELKAKLPSRITVSTIHRMGMGILSRVFRRAFQPNDFKYHDLANQVVERMAPPQKRENRKPDP
ncbi:MAG: AAA family ATPase [Cyanobacteriota bacterium]|nr:AAA family ATPase [Cyanobacteriota bacterium]